MLIYSSFDSVRSSQAILRVLTSIQLKGEGVGWVFLKLENWQASSKEHVTFTHWLSLADTWPKTSVFSSWRQFFRPKISRTFFELFISILKISTLKYPLAPNFSELGSNFSKETLQTALRGSPSISVDLVRVPDLGIPNRLETSRGYTLELIRGF